MTKEKFTEILLGGVGAEEFLARHGISGLDRDDNGNYVVARFGDDETSVDSGFGNLRIEHGLSKVTSQREVTIYGALRRKGSRNVRKVSLNHMTGSGFQEFSRTMRIGVRTNVGIDVFGQ